MAMVFKKYSGADFVVSSGTNLESLRLRSRLAKNLRLPAPKIQGWVGGEHGDAAIILWSTVKANNISVESYTSSTGKGFSRTVLDSYMKEISKAIVDSIGGTEYGPAASFRDITRAIVKDTGETLAVATPQRFEGIPEQIHVSVPLKMGNSIGRTIYETLMEDEKNGIVNAARAIHETYKGALEGLTQ